ncbi:MAG TPA: hypothetical protein GX720_01395 [Clostridiaceae bacterium]|nr:hypothetical protein [Clostridiaceae bacterium]
MTDQYKEYFADILNQLTGRDIPRSRILAVRRMKDGACLLLRGAEEPVSRTDFFLLRPDPSFAG